MSRTRRLTAIVAVAASLLSACSVDPPESLAAVETTPTARSVLRVATYDNAPLDHALTAWERDHPTVRVEVLESDIATHHAAIVEGTLEADLVAIDAHWLAGIRQDHELFVDTADSLGPITPTDAPDHIAAQVVVDEHVWARPASVGGLVLATRSDLVDVAALAGSDVDTWCDLIRTGDTWVSANELRFLPSVEPMFRAVIDQRPVDADHALTGPDGNAAIVDNPAVELAWDLSLLALGHPPMFGDPCEGWEGGRIAGNLPRFSAPWTEALAEGSFAATLVPAWALERLETGTGSTQSIWTHHHVPGSGGDRGGTSWAIPAAGNRADLAEDLLSWLTSPTQQALAWRQAGDLPAEAGLRGDVAAGPLAASVESVRAIPGPHDRAIVEILTTALERIEAGNAEPADAWEDALFRIRRLD